MKTGRARITEDPVNILLLLRPPTDCVTFLHPTLTHLTLVPLLLAAITQIANAQIVALGACPKVPQVADFNPQRYGGLWYEQEKYPFIFELGGKCVTAEYSLSADSTITVVNRQISTIQLAVPIILLASSLLSIEAQIASLGICPDVPKQHDFHPERFVGLWYEQERYPNVFELAAKCVTSEYSMNADTTFTITNKQINSL
ncbi:uncharacterized protein LOC120415597 [Culex pipiens pallens]|uniref:uncharacterized protein LOC120415597 n=1 Tax=Culex pipiens pallens TaxID=42434 RepID=UPI0022AA318D|nr:uncharacterized protein LOC120415597 [Culex pipiens pallens]